MPCWRTAPNRDDDGNKNDQSFGRDLEWAYSPLLYSYERGDVDNKLYEITEEEANQIAERIRRIVTGDQ